MNPTIKITVSRHQYLIHVGLVGFIEGFIECLIRAIVGVFTKIVCGYTLFTSKAVRRLRTAS